MSDPGWKGGGDRMIWILMMISQIREIPWKVAWSDLKLPGGPRKISQSIEGHIFKQKHVSIV